jgi:hypothetical protein
MNEPFDVKSKYLYPIVIFAVNGLFSSVELFAFVDVLATGVTPPEYQTL